MKINEILKLVIYKLLLIIDEKLEILPDSKYLKIKYYMTFRKKLNIDNPKSYNEKLQWLKLYDRNKKYTTLVDKYEVKKYVASVIGEDYIIPTIAVFNSFDDIDFSKLPDKFVIKCTHDSGGLIICSDKSKLNIKNARRIINKSLKKNYYRIGREWPYKNVKRKIIIEKYMQDFTDGELRDYKFFCFNGKAKLMFIASNRQGKGDTYFDFFDLDFNHLSFEQGHPNAPSIPHKPINFDKMIVLAEKLSKNIPHVRVDFYEVNGKIYFGEMTFFHYSGFTRFNPEKWDFELGKLINLPNKKERKK